MCTPRNQGDGIGDNPIRHRKVGVRGVPERRIFLWARWEGGRLRISHFRRDPARPGPTTHNLQLKLADLVLFFFGGGFYPVGHKSDDRVEDSTLLATKTTTVWRILPSWAQQRR